MLLVLSTSIQISWSITKIVRTALQEKTEKCKLWCCASSFPTTLMKKLDKSLLIWHKLRRNCWFSKLCVAFPKFIAKITYMAIWSLRTSSSRVMIGCLSQIWIHTNLSHSLSMISRTTTCTLETWTTIQDAIFNHEIASERWRSPGENPDLKLHPAMDIFSVGCQISELLMDGLPLFSLSKLQQYRKEKFDPRETLGK